jgi:hypothetical protein
LATLRTAVDRVLERALLLASLGAFRGIGVNAAIAQLMRES